ncbi:hypothetical protein MFMK1_003139 [Metallumcola ferriviriculae]|uniref:Uncharacterized protein n=1 Tax=Metallumcola ferriviriculae TaxID=3039180 RepID=A0AAU0US91_9FIRM|nr:hypothetical protein MFMK1_003139 [Desulfitibacteraceae bacterium MK1]
MGFFNTVVFSILIIAALVYIYQQRENEEEYLVLKLIGYYFLGSFRFNINQLYFPLGFIIFLIVFKPNVNRKIKHWAAYLGLAAFLIGLASHAY